MTEPAIAPGAQGRLFATPPTSTTVRLVVVAHNGHRTPPVEHVGVAAAQAHATLRTSGSAWVEGSDGRTIEISLHDGEVAVVPREPGWPAVIARLMADQANPTEEQP